MATRKSIVCLLNWYEASAQLLDHKHILYLSLILAYQVYNSTLAPTVELTFILI